MNNLNTWLPLFISIVFLVFLYAVWQRYTIAMDKPTKLPEGTGGD